MSLKAEKKTNSNIWNQINNINGRLNKIAEGEKKVRAGKYPNTGHLILDLLEKIKEDLVIKRNKLYKIIT